MCLIAYSPTKKFSDKFIRNVAINNSHGFGLMWSDGENLHTFKTMNLDDFILKYEEIFENGYRPALHWRMSTHGSKTRENCHPFLLAGGTIGMMHNGMFAQFNAKSSYYEYASYSYAESAQVTLDTPSFDKSDTYQLSEKLANITWEDVSRFEEDFIYQHFLGTNRLFFMNNKGEVKTFNDKAQSGGWHDDIWYSNGNYLNYYIYVYGSLRKGMGNHKAYLEGCPTEGKVKIKGLTMFALSDYVPAVVKNPTGEIVAERYIVSRSTLDKLDRLEGYPYLYDRMVVKDEEGKPGLIYFYKNDTVNSMSEKLLKEVKNGDWVAHIESRKKIYIPATAYKAPSTTAAQNSLSFSREVNEFKKEQKHLNKLKANGEHIRNKTARKRDDLDISFDYVDD